MKALMIAGDRSGSGKTSITLAIGALLSGQMTVQTFKAGMDYIDPSYLTGVTGRPCRNLDSFVMSDPEIRGCFAHACEGAECALVEGVRGLYEGAEAIDDTGSSAAIAKLLGIPVVLVVSARSITRSAAAIVKGFAAFDPGIRIAGVILNQVMGPRHAEKATTAIEHHCGVPVVGAIPRLPEMELTMRHLGLVPYLEGQGDAEFRRRVGEVARLIGEHVDIGRFLSLAQEVRPAPERDGIFPPAESPDVRIGVALDEAFNFYYADLFDLLPAMGAEPVFFSPIHDRLPEMDGMVIGGGYPELYLPALEANGGMREAIREASASGMPIYAECGGLMYLTDRIVCEKGWRGSAEERSGEMCGVFSGETLMPARRIVAYVEGESSAASPLGPGRFRGHEFHYSDVRLAPGTMYAYRLSRGTGIAGNNDGAVTGRTLGSYTHLHPLASRGLFAHFVGECRREA
jgi:cobyrinic acid a,c-diamide synthase